MNNLIVTQTDLCVVAAIAFMAGCMFGLVAGVVKGEESQRKRLRGLLCYTCERILGRE